MTHQIIYKFLNKKLSCKFIINKIIFYSLNVINIDLKKDISTFYFTWSAYIKYVSFLKKITSEEQIYLDSLHKIKELISNKIDKNKLRMLTISANNYKNYEKYLLNLLKKKLLNFSSLNRLLFLKKLNLIHC